MVDAIEILAAGKVAGDRFPGLVSAFTDWAGSEGPPLRVAIEDLPYVKNRTGFGALARVLGYVHGCCLDRGFETAIVPGTRWKKALGLPGNANKETITTWVRTNHPDEELDSQDLRDAFCVALAATRDWDGLLV